MRIAAAIGRSLSLLSDSDRVRLIVILVLQAFVTLLDLFAILIVGLVVSSIAMSQGGLPLTDGAPHRSVSDSTSSLQSGTEEFGILSLMTAFMPSIGLLLALAGGALIFRSLISLWITRRTYRFLANRQANLSSTICRELLQGSVLQLTRRTSQETAFALVQGVSAATVNTLGPAVIAMSEVTLILVIAIGLFIVDPIVALFSILFFGMLATILQFALGSWANKIGERMRVADVDSMATIQESMHAFREIIVSGRSRFFIDRFARSRRLSSRAIADSFVLSQIGKYVFEIGLVIGAGLLVILLTLSKPFAVALGILAVFLLAASRLMPSLLRLQTALATIRMAEGSASETFVVISELGMHRVIISTHTTSKPVPLEVLAPDDFDRSIELEHISFRYPGSVLLALDDVTFRVNPGDSLAIVGETGSGKSTLADIILGILTPSKGEVCLSGRSPADAISHWPGRIAYVPQVVTLMQESIRQNVALGVPQEFIDDELVWAALERARLDSFVASLPMGLDEPIGEHGMRLSGGQRQRLGIARALYSQPRLIVLDEATSALDAQTEKEVGAALSGIATEASLVVVAHRLNTIKDFHNVLYLKNGQVQCYGDFAEVRMCVPAFNRQASLLGL